MNPSAPAYLAVGRIGRAHGIHGEVAVDVLTEFPDRFDPGVTLYIGPENAPAPVAATVVSARPTHDRLLVRFDLAADRTAAQALTGLFAFIPIAEAHSLDPGSFYTYQLIGMAVVTADGRDIGRVTGLIETGSADVIEVRGPAGSTLVPLIADIVSDIDVAANRITITPLPGLIDDDT